MEKFELQILLLENSLGLTINHKLSSKYSVPLIPYYFWPINEAWEQIRFELSSKYWISNMEQVQILNFVADIMNNWQQNKATLPKNLIKKISDSSIILSINIIGLP